MGHWSVSTHQAWPAVVNPKYHATGQLSPVLSVCQPYGLQESRYRQRYLDTIVNGHVRDIFVTRARIIRFLRSYFDERGFLEVRTCLLHILQGPSSLE